MGLQTADVGGHAGSASVPAVRGWAAAVGSTWVCAAGELALVADVAEVAAAGVGADVAALELAAEEDDDGDEEEAAGAVGAGVFGGAPSSGQQRGRWSRALALSGRSGESDRAAWVGNGRYTVTPYYGKSVVEGQHRARYLARLHRPKRLVDVVQPTAPRHQLVQLQSTLTVELEIARDVDAKSVRAHARGLYAALWTNRHP